MNTSPNPSPASSPPSVRRGFALLVRLLMIASPYWRQMSYGVLMSLAIGVVSLITPLFPKVFFDKVYPVRSGDMLLPLVLGILIVGLVTAVMTMLKSIHSQVIGAKLSTELSLTFFNHVQHLDSRFFDEHRTGELVSRAGDLRQSLAFMSSMFESVFVNGIYLVAIPPLLFYLNWRLALMAFALLPLTMIVSLLSGRRMRALSKSFLEHSAEASAQHYEVLANVRLFKSGGAERYALDGIRTRLNTTRNAQLRVGIFNARLEIVTGMISACGLAVYTYLAWSLLITNQLSLGTFIAFGSYVVYMNRPFAQFPSIYASFQQTAVALARFFEYYDTVPEQNPQAALLSVQQPRTALTGDIQFDDVSFEYAPGRRVLRHASFKIPGLGMTAIVGRSGEGKSSVVKLLLRLYHPQSGSILVGARPIHTIPHHDLRTAVGVVWQTTEVLRGTVRDNLRVFDSERSDTDLWGALETVRLAEFVLELPEGLDTNIGEAGRLFSGGQLQRLAIARTIIRKPRYLVLDEATSNLDAVTEVLILDALRKYCACCAVILVTHRLANACKADRILVVREGQVTGGVAHDEMLKRSNEYRQMWDASASQAVRPDPLLRGLHA